MRFELRISALNFSALTTGPLKTYMNKAKAPEQEMVAPRKNKKLPTNLATRAAKALTAAAAKASTAAAASVAS
jgi:hypothetical protein